MKVLKPGAAGLFVWMWNSAGFPSLFCSRELRSSTPMPDASRRSLLTKTSSPSGLDGIA